MRLARVLGLVAPAPEPGPEAPQVGVPAEEPDPTPRKRKKEKRTKKPPKTYPAPVKIPKKNAGCAYAIGINEWGQLGRAVGRVVQPMQIPGLENVKVKMVACGGAHTLVLDKEGNVWSFGCNTEKALGRKTTVREEEVRATIVELPNKVKQVSAGDSHSAALTVDGEVYAWGCYKAKDGKRYGVDSYLPDETDAEFTELPWLITLHFKEEYDDARVIKIVSGAHHLVLLGDDSRLYTCGAWDYGQLGRVQSDIPPRRTRNLIECNHGCYIPDKEYYMKPRQVPVGHKYAVKNIWAGRYSTFCYAGNEAQMYVCGHNLYSQLGITREKEVKGTKEGTTYIKQPSKNTFFNKEEFSEIRWRQIAAGTNHTVGLTEQGQVYTVGNYQTGKLGLGVLNETERNAQNEHKDIGGKLQRVQGLLKNRICVQVAADDESSYALTLDGQLYVWGSDGFVELLLQEGGVTKNKHFVPQLCPNIYPFLGSNQEVCRFFIGNRFGMMIIADKMAPAAEDVAPDPQN